MRVNKNPFHQKMNTDERELSKSHDAILLEYDATRETPPLK